MHELLTSVVGEWMLQSANPGYYCVCLSIRSSKIFVWFPYSSYFSSYSCCLMLWWQRNLRIIFAQRIRLLYQAQKYKWKITYNLTGGEIHGKQIEPSFSFVHPYIGKLWLVVEALVDLFPMACVQISLFARSAIQCCVSVMAQLKRGYNLVSSFIYLCR